MVAAPTGDSDATKVCVEVGVEFGVVCSAGGETVEGVTGAT